MQSKSATLPLYNNNKKDEEESKSSYIAIAIATAITILFVAAVLYFSIRQRDKSQAISSQQEQGEDDQMGLSESELREANAMYDELQNMKETCNKSFPNEQPFSLINKVCLLLMKPSWGPRVVGFTPGTVDESDEAEVMREAEDMIIAVGETLKEPPTRRQMTFLKESLAMMRIVAVVVARDRLKLEGNFDGMSGPKVLQVLWEAGQKKEQQNQSAKMYMEELIKELALAKKAAKLVKNEEPFKLLFKTCQLLLRPDDAPNVFAVPTVYRKLGKDGQPVNLDALSVARLLSPATIALERLYEDRSQLDVNSLKVALVIASEIAVDVARKHFNKEIEFNSSGIGTAETIELVAQLTK